MAKIGDRFKTDTKCEATGSYIFDGYTEPGPPAPATPTAEERVIPLRTGETFPPIKSTSKGAWWKLQRVG